MNCNDKTMTFVSTYLFLLSNTAKFYYKTPNRMLEIPTFCLNTVIWVSYSMVSKTTLLGKKK